MNKQTQFYRIIKGNHQTGEQFIVTENSKNTCCGQLNWEFIQDASHARACEFTHGKCTNCGTNLIHLFHTMGNHEHYVSVEPEFIEEMQKLEGNDRKQFMKKWYDDMN